MSETRGFESRRSKPQARLAELAERGKSRVAYGILISAILAAVKMISGIVGNSHALIADGVESMMDIVSSLDVAVHIEPTGLELTDPGRP